MPQSKDVSRICDSLPLPVCDDITLCFLSCATFCIILSVLILFFTCKCNDLVSHIDPYLTLKQLKINNVNRIVCAQLNINSIRNKFDQLKYLISGNVDVLIITETKLNDTFPESQFFIEGFTKPYRLDRSDRQGGIMIFIRDNIPSKTLSISPMSHDIECLFIELNFRNRKWLLNGTYIPHKSLGPLHLQQLGYTLDLYVGKFDNYLLLGDFNMEVSEDAMRVFCDTYDLKSLINVPTCFKSLSNPSSIDLILTNNPRSFMNTQVIETGLSDHHLMTVTVTKTHVPKSHPSYVTYRDYKRFNNKSFRIDLSNKLNSINVYMTYEEFEEIYIDVLDKHAPCKQKIIRANEAPFMDKNLKKAIMKRSSLRNRYLKLPSVENFMAYKSQRNFCTNLLRQRKREYFNKLDTKLISDNKTFWRTIKPFFTDKVHTTQKITLIENDEIITDNAKVANIFNDFFSNVVLNLNIEENSLYISDTEGITDPVLKAIKKYENHPSIVKIKENVDAGNKFNFSRVSSNEMGNIVNNLDVSKANTYKNIPTKVFKQNVDIYLDIITNIYNNSIIKPNFSSKMKCADINPVHKKDDCTNKSNYRPVSILPCVSKVFERLMNKDIINYIEQYLSNRLCGFRHGYSAQTTLIIMLEELRKYLDKGYVSGILLTDLSKAFDCLVHDLLIAKLSAYGFDYKAMEFIHCYLSNRKQRTKVCTSFSEWSNITIGVPQGSILGPLLFNIYINDIFLFNEVTNIANYADDNTPYTCDKSSEQVIARLEKDSCNLFSWFKSNYLKPNIDKSHLLMSKACPDLHIVVGNDIIYNSTQRKLLGITFDSALSFDVHVFNLCKKASQKLNALARISSYMSQTKLKIIMNAFITSQFGYCPLVWMFHSRGLNNRINRIHERALRLVYNDTQSTFAELLSKDKSFSIHHRNLQALAIEIFKTINGDNPLMKSIFVMKKTKYNLRGAALYTNNVNTVKYGTESLSFRGAKTWSMIPEEIKSSRSLSEFKIKIKKWNPIGCKCNLCKIYVPSLGFI